MGLRRLSAAQQARDGSDRTLTSFLLPDSEQDLRNKINNHEAEVEKMRGERENTKNTLADEQDALAVYERKRSAAQTTHGRLQALEQVRTSRSVPCFACLLTVPFCAQRHQDLLEARKSLIRELAEKHEIPGYDHSLSDHEMQNFEEQLESSIVAQQRKLDRIKVGDLALPDVQLLTDTSMFGAERGPCRREQAPGSHL